MADTQPSVAALGLSKDQYIQLCDTLRGRAHAAHDNARAWANRALAAEQRLSIYEPGDEPNTEQGTDAKAGQVSFRQG